MYTSIVLVALVGPGASPENKAAESPAWQADYVDARKLGRREKKPLAVFVGSGPKGWEKLSQQGAWPPGVKKRLARDYVCVYVDADSPRGKRLAGAFAMTQGLVVSTRDGDAQAFRHSGRMSAQDLESILTRYANGRDVGHTEGLQQRTSYSYDPTATGTPTVAPAQFAYPSQFGGFGGFGGGFGGGGFGGGGSC
jgi:hypothetical protein